MILQRYKIQLENYESKRTTILKQLEPVNAELSEIDNKIKLETSARNQAWRELFRKNRQLALPDPAPITNFQSEISKCKSELDSLTIDLADKVEQLESLRRETLTHHANGQDVINQEISIHSEEKERIKTKLSDINNDYVARMIELLELKSNNQQVLVNSMDQLCRNEEDILNCKKIEKQNRCIIMNLLKNASDLRRNYKNRVMELDSEATQLTSTADEMAKLRTTLQIRLQHLTSLQSTNPSDYADLTPEIDNIQYQLDTIDRKLNRIAGHRNQIQQEIAALALQRDNDIANLPSAPNIMHPIPTPFKQLTTTKNTLLSTISELKTRDNMLDANIALTTRDYEIAIDQLKEEDQRANERLQIMITRCNSQYSNKHADIKDQMTILSDKLTTLKRQIFMKKKEIDNWESAYKTECKYQYRKSQLITQHDKLQSALDQVDKDIIAIRNAISIAN